MKTLLVLLFGLSSLAHAARLHTRLQALGEVHPGDDEVMVLAEGEGRVLWAPLADPALVRALTEAQAEKLWLLVDFDLDSARIKGVQLLAAPALEARDEAVEKQFFTPTVLSTFQEAQALFNRQDKRTKRHSQCFNRAHGWAYDMWRLAGVSTQKVFIFFTQRYIRNYRYKWWFHVAPYTLVQSSQGPIEHVLDVTFSRGPLQMRPWTDMFMQNNAPCPTVQSYSQYRLNQDTQDCYLLKTSMYYRVPSELERLESEGVQKHNWSLVEIAQARQEAFIDWQRYNP